MVAYFGGRVRVVVVVPWRTDDGVRERVWTACRRRWETLFRDWPIYEGVSPDGPFNRSAAINDAAKQAGEWDVALVIDADVMLPAQNVREAVKRAAKTGRVTWAHRRWRSISQEDSERILDKPSAAEGALGPGGIERADFTRADIDLIVDKTTPLSWSCCMAVRRDAWETIDGFDERFVGWGFEDGAFQAMSGGLVGWDRIEGDVLNFWHPRERGAGKADRDSRNRHTPQALSNGRLGMRYMVALRRDYGLTDRPESHAPPDVIERDIANLRKQDDGFALGQTADERKAFDSWWPTLEELRAGARVHRVEPVATVTVIVHTGGSPEAWPERRAYLRTSLASLAEQVSGPIVQSVVYDCWGDAAIRAEIEAMLPPGFYIVGPTIRPDGYTASMKAMWSYLAKRTKGEYIFQAEDDFTYARPVDLGPMVETLRHNPNLVQIALLRDACYQDERETGGILGWPVPAFTRAGENGTPRLEHRLFFTCNPSIFRRSLTERPWPSGHHSETLFGKALLRDERVRFAFWGSGEEWVRHIGQVRAGTGY